MAKILLIETATEVCSTAISVDGQLRALSENLNTLSHASLLTLQIRECCEAAGVSLAELDAVALSRGPGGYTALRVGASVAKGICYALDKPLIAVDTLRALAQASMGKDEKADYNTLYVPLLDARRQEVWLAMYDAHMVERAPAQSLILENNSFENYIQQCVGEEWEGRIVLAGNGIHKVRSGGFLKKAVFSSVEKCSAYSMIKPAEAILQKADFQDIAYFEPFYMKPPNITTPNKPLF